MRLQISNSTLQTIYKNVLEGNPEVAKLAYNLMFNQNDEFCQPYQKIETLEKIESELLKNIHAEYMNERKKRQERWGALCLK